MSEHATRYIVGHGIADTVSDRTALPHRVLRFDDYGDAHVYLQRSNGETKTLLQMSRAELALLARAARRAAARRFFARLIGRR